MALTRLHKCAGLSAGGSAPLFLHAIKSGFLRVRPMYSYHIFSNNAP